MKQVADIPNFVRFSPLRNFVSLDCIHNMLEEFEKTKITGKGRGNIMIIIASKKAL